MPKLSIHIATRNNAKYIEECLRSVLAEPCKDFELAVFDDASTDANWDLIGKTLEGIPNARAFRTEKHIGASKARQRLLDLTDSQYVMSIDGDDVHLPGTLNERVEFLEAAPSCAGAYGVLIQVDETLKPLAGLSGRPFSRFLLPYQNMIPHSECVMRRKDILDAGGYLETGEGAESISEDYFLWFRLALTKDFKLFNRAVYLYRSHPGQQTKTKKSLIDPALQWIAMETLKLRPDIASALLARTPTAMLKHFDWRAVELVAAILCRCSPDGSAPAGELLELAAKFAPDDYGIELVRYDFHLAKGEGDKALAACESLLKRFPQESFIRSKALAMKLNALEISKASFDRAAIEREIAKAQSLYPKIM